MTIGTQLVMIMGMARIAGIMIIGGEIGMGGIMMITSPRTDIAQVMGLRGRRGMEIIILGSGGIGMG